MATMRHARRTRASSASWREARQARAVMTSEMAGMAASVTSDLKSESLPLKLSQRT